MSCSEAQLEANRLNAQKSTGPQTPEGKAASAGNATKHGYFSQAVLIKGEDPAEFREVLEQYVLALHPNTVVERELVERIVASIWKRMRLQKLEAAFWKAPSFFPNHGGAFLRQNTYEQRLDSLYFRCMREYRTLRKQFLFGVDSRQPPEEMGWMELEVQPQAQASIVRNEAKPAESLPEERMKERNEAKLADQSIERIGNWLKATAPPPGNVGNEPNSAGPEPIFEPLSGPNKGTQEAVQAFLRQRKEHAKKTK
jgi:hypothetical protein